MFRNREFVRFYLGEKTPVRSLAELRHAKPRRRHRARRRTSARRLHDRPARDRDGDRVGPATPDGPSTIDEACAALATLVGAVTLARAVEDPALARKLASSAERALSTPRRAPPTGSKPHRRPPRAR